MSSSISLCKQQFLAQVQAVEIKILIEIRLNAITLPIWIAQKLKYCVTLQL